MTKKVFAFALLAIAVLMLFIVVIATGRADTTGNRPNSIGADKIYVNPYSYRLALLIDGQVLEGKYTNIRFWPYGTPDLYDESVLFCGNVESEFNGRRGVLVITFRTQASRLYRGVPCHELISVFEVDAK